jgi:hypothetical protein
MVRSTRSARFSNRKRQVTASNRIGLFYRRRRFDRHTYCHGFDGVRVPRFGDDRSPFAVQVMHQAHRLDVLRTTIVMTWHGAAITAAISATAASRRRCAGSSSRSPGSERCGTFLDP